jgi:hypothetical protein
MVSSLHLSYSCPAISAIGEPKRQKDLLPATWVKLVTASGDTSLLHPDYVAVDAQASMSGVGGGVRSLIQVRPNYLQSNILSAQVCAPVHSN